MDLVEGDANKGHALPSEDDRLSLVHVECVAMQLHRDLLNQPLNKAALLTEENQMQGHQSQGIYFGLTFLGDRRCWSRLIIRNRVLLLGE